MGNDEAPKREILPEISAKAGDIVRKHCLFTMTTILTPEAGGGDHLQCRSGGWPYLPVYVDWPRDKNGKRMRFIAQLAFGRMPTGRYGPALGDGLLLLFLSSDYRSFNRKDRGWYSLIMVQNLENLLEAEFPDVEPLPSNNLIAKTYMYVRKVHQQEVSTSLNESGVHPAEVKLVEHWMTNNFAVAESDFKQTHQVLGIDDFGELARIVCAFHANGVSFSLARMKDSCYEHLVKDAENWMAFWKICGAPLMNFGENRELYICIRKEDLELGQWEKFQAVFVGDFD